MKPFPAISEYLNGRIASGDFPSAVYMAARGGVPVFADAVGDAVVVPERKSARLDTVYDLASLTKVLVTGLLAAELIGDGGLRLEDPIAKYFNGFSDSGKGETTLLELLTHTSGFAGWVPLYIKAGSDTPVEERKERVLEVIAGEPLAAARGEKVIYSDLNFILLGFLIEQIHGRDLSAVARERIFEPLNLRDTFFNPPTERLDDIAASEEGNSHERGTCVEMGYDADAARWRTHIVRGEVHDGNCLYLGGVAGHAGLFSSAADVLTIARQFLPSTSTMFSESSLGLFTNDYTAGMDEARSLAFQLASTPESTASAALSPRSFGHLGFTGTSLWMDPESDSTYILLTNRTHARKPPFENINGVRRNFHSIAHSALEGA